MPTPRPSVYLASRSPRRRHLLSEAGIAHAVVETGLDDGALSGGSVGPIAWTLAMAYLKAAAGLRRLASPGVVIGADTVCVAGDEVIGQPRDRRDAERILRRLACGSHRVVTGVALVEGSDDAVRGRRVIDLFADASVVRVGALGEREIAAYLGSGQWRGKAGAYNLVERIEAGWPIEYQGDPGTIMGMPILELIRRHGWLASGAAARGGA